MFPWHSTVVNTAERDYSTSNSPARAAFDVKANDPSSIGDKDATAARKKLVMQEAFSIMCDSVRRAQRDPATGRLAQPAALLQDIERAGVKLGPEGAGTLLAIADSRTPAWEEWCRCMLTEGTQVEIPSTAQPLQSPKMGRGRGLGHLCSAAATATAPTSARGRGGAGAGAGAASRGRGASLGSSGRGRLGASMGASRGRGDGASRGSVGRGRGGRA